MRRLSDRFGEAALRCTDLQQLGTILRDAAHDLGFAHFALLDHASLHEGATGFVRIDNYPEDWVRELTENGAGLDDPVHLASRRVGGAFRWADLPQLIALQKHHRTILSRSRHHGLGEGFTIASNIAGEPSGSCSFAVRRGLRISNARLACAELVGLYALRAARRLRPRRTPARPRLSRREVQCLRLVALGKSDWEIGRIIGVSPHTARQYVKRARAAYDVVSRAQLVACGLRDGWISMEEAIPPIG